MISDDSFQIPTFYDYSSSVELEKFQEYNKEKKKLYIQARFLKKKKFKNQYKIKGFYSFGLGLISLPIMNICNKY